MVKDKVLKVLSTIFECIGIGGLLVYLYNYFTLKGKYDVVPAEIKANLNTYLLIGISGALLFVIFKVLKYFTKPRRNNDFEQMKMHLEEETPVNTNETYNNNYNDYSNKEIRDLKIEPNYMYEEKKIYENRYVVPVEKQTTCSNCGSIVDKSATICLHCGFLLQPIEAAKDRFEEQKFIIQTFKKLEDKFGELFDKIDKKIESFSITSNTNKSIDMNITPIIKEEKYEQPYEKSYVEPSYNSPYDYIEPAKEKESSKDILFLVKYYMNKLLPIIGIVLLLIVGGSLLFNSLNKKDNPSEISTKTSFYEIANNIIGEVESKYKNIGMTLSKNTMYYTLKDLSYTSSDYNADKSYIAINTTDRNNVKYYISLVGTGNYDKYSINITEKNDLDVTDVVMNTATVSDLDGKLLIDSGSSVTIYYKE